MIRLFVFAVFAPVMATAQSEERKILTSGVVNTIPSGTRFAIGTKYGTFSVESRDAVFVRAGKKTAFADLRQGSSVSVLGSISPTRPGARATIRAVRVEIALAAAPTTRRPAPLKNPAASTAPRPRLMKSGTTKEGAAPKRDSVKPTTAKRTARTGRAKAVKTAKTAATGTSRRSKTLKRS